MNQQLRQQLITALQQNIHPANDVSHDILHAIRVAELAMHIAETEGGNIDIIYPAALYHDIVCYPKNSPQTNTSTHDSALVCRKILTTLNYPAHLTEEIARIIANCSFSKGIQPQSLEEKIVKDADMLEASGAIAIMRTFASAGSMQTPFYCAADPFREHSEPEKCLYGLDLFYMRLLKIPAHLYTATARHICSHRTKFLNAFIDELRQELAMSNQDISQPQMPTQKTA